MVNPISDTSKSLIQVSDSQKQKNSSKENNEHSSVNVALSDQAMEFTKFEGDSLLVGILKKEFDEVFEFVDDKKGLFLEKLDHILVDNGL